MNMTNCIEYYNPNFLLYKQVDVTNNENKLFLLMSSRAWGNITTGVQIKGGARNQSIAIVRLQLDLIMNDNTSNRIFFFSQDSPRPPLPSWGYFFFSLLLSLFIFIFIFLN